MAASTPSVTDIRQAICLDRQFVCLMGGESDSLRNLLLSLPARTVAALQLTITTHHLSIEVFPEIVQDHPLLASVTKAIDFVALWSKLPTDVQVAFALDFVDFAGCANPSTWSASAFFHLLTNVLNFLFRGISHPLRQDYHDDSDEDSEGAPGSPVSPPGLSNQLEGFTGISGKIGPLPPLESDSESDASFSSIEPGAAPSVPSIDCFFSNACASPPPRPLSPLRIRMSPLPAPAAKRPHSPESPLPSKKEKREMM